MTVRHWLQLAPLAAVAGCLQSPPQAGDANGGGPDDAGDGESDASPCPVVVEDGFDNISAWVPFMEPGSTVIPSSDQVRLLAAPKEGPSAYCEIRSTAQSWIGGATLTAELVVAVSDGSGGVSWNFDPVPAMEEDDDLFSLGVVGGVLQAVRKQPSGEFVVLCDPCPPYSSTDHARFRLRASSSEVFYETSPDGGEWSSLVGPEPISETEYQAVAYAVATNPDAFDMTVDSMQWRACAE